MKQRHYTELQIEIMKVIFRLSRYFERNEHAEREVEQIKKDYGIEEPYLTLREYINKHACGAYHTFNFTIGKKKISINTISNMLTDDLCALYPLTNKFYVVEDKRESVGATCENYHCEHNLVLEPKED